jgi:hypothetical protein
MSHILKIASGINVLPVRLALERNPGLWNQQRHRTKDGPHVGADDIWVRFNDLANFDCNNPATFLAPHESVWYPEYAHLKCVDDIIFPLMFSVKAERLGGVLITRVKAHSSLRPHVDNGWHARYYDKYAVQICANHGQSFRFQDECLITMPGDVYWFDNAYPHWVVNESNEDRITMIVCLGHAKTGE